MKEEINSDIKEEVLNDLGEDIINPSHYNGNIQIIDVMKQQFGTAAVMDFCILNSFKYISRAYKKHATPKEDTLKAKWYLNKYLELYPEIYECG